MAIVTASATDAGDVFNTWKVPAQFQDTPIPRGLREYQGTVAVAAKLAADQTRVIITFTFPANWVFRLKQITAIFQSDDQTIDFDSVGSVGFSRSGATLGNLFPLVSDGIHYRGGSLQASRIYQLDPMTALPFISGPDGHTCLLSLSDTSADASAAGDVYWVADFYQYDIDQCLSWGVNTPSPVVSS